MRSAGDPAHGLRLRGLIAILWRSGLRIQEALALIEGDLDHRRGSLLVRCGKGGRRREVGMDAWGWSTAALARAAARTPDWSAAVRHQRHHARTPLVAGRSTRRTATHCRRSRSPAPLRAAPTAPRSRGRDDARRRAVGRHPAATRARNLGITSVYLEGIDSGEIIETVHARRAPMIPVSTWLRL
jgi:hypothetical protein